MDVLRREQGVLLDRLFAPCGLHDQRRRPALPGRGPSPPSLPGRLLPKAGPGGIAVLAAYSLSHPTDLTLNAYLDREVSAATELETIERSPADVAGFGSYVRRFVAGLTVEVAGTDRA